MATWYRPQPNAPKPAAKPVAAPRTPAPRKPSWAQLRARMAMADELLTGWVESIGTCEREVEVAALPAPKLTAVAGTRIDAQFIAVQRTQLAAVPSRTSQDAPLRLLQQLSLGSRYRLAAVVA